MEFHLNFIALMDKIEAAADLARTITSCFIDTDEIPGS